MQSKYLVLSHNFCVVDTTMVYINLSVPRHLALQEMKYRCVIKSFNYAKYFFLDSLSDFSCHYNLICTEKNFLKYFRIFSDFCHILQNGGRGNQSPTTCTFIFGSTQIWCHYKEYRFSVLLMYDVVPSVLHRQIYR